MSQQQRHSNTDNCNCFTPVELRAEEVLIDCFFLPIPDERRFQEQQQVLQTCLFVGSQEVPLPLSFSVQLSPSLLFLGGDSTPRRGIRHEDGTSSWSSPLDTIHELSKVGLQRLRCPKLKGNVRTSQFERGTVDLLLVVLLWLRCYSVHWATQI